MKKIVITKDKPKGVIVDLTELEKIRLEKDIIKTKELKDAEQNAINNKASGNQKLLDLGLTQAEATALTGYTPPVSE